MISIVFVYSCFILKIVIVYISSIYMLINRVIRVVLDNWGNEKLRFINSLILFHLIYYLFLIWLHFHVLLHFVDTIDPSKIFQECFADICEAIEVKLLFIVNRLFSAKLISSIFKSEVESVSGDPYNIANKVVNELQRQVDEKGIGFLKAICDFLLNQNQELKDISTRIKSQLESKTFYNTTL